MTRAVVFAYHNVGYRCLSVLLDQGVEVPLILSHADNPKENIWFHSVSELAEKYGIPLITPEDPNTPEVRKRIQELQPDFFFSFYYRNMLSQELLQIPKRGSLNMHGSLLPKYRGRVPVNWAILHGEKETGASLHYMELKPDSGALVDQQAVPILLEDTALEVFHKVTWAAELVLNRSLPRLLAGSAPGAPLDLKQGRYFGGRRAEDGRIDWSLSALQVHNLIRAVAPPYPGAFSDLVEKPIRFLRSQFTRENSHFPELSPCLYCEAGKFYVDCRDGVRLRILALEIYQRPCSPETFLATFGHPPCKLL